MGRVDALLAKLATPEPPLRVVLVVLILALPTLCVGFQVDDRWLTWRNERLEPLALPKVGERRRL